MMEHYVTLFDSLFLPQGMALHASLERHAGSYTLWVLCIDDAAFQALQKLALPNMRLLAVDDVLTDDLRRVQPTRSRAEWCWTLTPFTPRFVFDAEPTARRVTYLDADVWLARSPQPVFEEFEASGKAVQITEHAYSPDYDQSDTSGRFCVQFMTFERCGGEPVRSWWAERCTEWCFARFEDGKFGDQKYLDDWPNRFGEVVHVLQDRSLMQGPWNATRFPPSEAVAYHFHGLRTLRKQRVLLTRGYRLPRATIAQLYRPYGIDLRNSHGRLSAVGVIPIPQVCASLPLLFWRQTKDRLRIWLYGLFPQLFMQL